MPKSQNQQDKIAAYKEKAKEKARAAKKAYLARPDVQERLERQKTALKKMQAERRQKIKEARKAKLKTEKSAFAEAKQITRKTRQNRRDEEVQKALKPATLLHNVPRELPAEDSTSQQMTSTKPRLTVIRGGKDSKSSVGEE
jgi:hypothetical protein